jgi:glucokinase
MTRPSSVTIGLDVGCTTMAGGLVTAAGDVLTSAQVPTGLDSRGSVQTILGMVSELAAEARARGLAVEAVGIGMPGLVDVERGVHRASAGGAFLAELHGVPLAELASARTGVPAFMDNDVNALALGEWMFGVARGATSCVVLAIGSAVGAGIILDGRLVRGRNGFAGELGHVTVDLDGPRCPCGARGCLALSLGGKFLAEEAARRAEREPTVMLAMAGGRAAAITAETVFAAAAAGDTVARGMVERAVRALGGGLSIMVNTLDPGLIVVTGGVVASLLPLRDEVLRRTREHTLAEFLAGTTIHFAPAHKGQTVRGGAALVLYERARRAASLAR